jgi:GT2 family glycosyltransferase
MGTVGVEIAVKDDERLLLALESLAQQTRLPDHVLVAASPKTPDPLVAAASTRWPSLHVEVVRFAGGPVDARTSSVPYLREDVTAFLDSDEIAPPGWLATIVAPIEGGHAAYTGGPTRPLRPAENPIERYYELLEESIYADLVPASVTYLPLGNSAWRTSLVREFGFDPRVTAEDHDLETRVQRAGYTGLYLPEAWVYHDKSNETSYVRWARKRYLYLFQMAMSMLKNEELGQRLQERRKPVAHPLRYVEAMMKPFALAHAWVRWSRVGDRPPARPPTAT